MNVITEYVPETGSILRLKNIFTGTDLCMKESIYLYRTAVILPAILAFGMFITWIPNMKNHKWGFKKVDGKIKWTKYNNTIDEKRTRLLLWPWITVFFELSAFFNSLYSLYPSDKNEALMYIFGFLTIALITVWALTTTKKK